MKKNLAPITAQKTIQKKSCSQKRNVVTLKIFVTPEEKIQIEKQVGEFKSVSNLLRHYLGLKPNVKGRRKQVPRDLLNLNDEEFDELFKNFPG